MSSTFDYNDYNDLNSGQRSNMRLFGLPYQFIDSVDKKTNYGSGYRYSKNIIQDAPIISILPGRPKYLQGAEDKDSLIEAIKSAGESGGSTILDAIDGNSNPGNTIKYYDFQRDYPTYINYVNSLCRTGALMLGLEDYKLDSTPLTSYDWRNYQYKYTDDDGNDVRSDIMGDILRKGYVQFYIDPDASGNESISNEVSESKIKGMLETGQDLLKELQFITGTLGAGGVVDGIEGFVTSSLDSLASAIGSTTSVGKALNRIMSTTSNIIKGENIIMPDIYQRSSYDKQYTFTVRLKTPYGTKLGFFMDCYVPLCHLLALGLPKQTTANTYGSPFIVKAYVSGVFSCNLGMVTSISINKNVNDTFVNKAGVPSEMDVSVTITDLYSELSMSKGNDPLLFMNNTSLIQYIATNCGIDMLQPALNTKIKGAVTNFLNGFQDVLPGWEGEIENLMANMAAAFMNY